jgi:hypothetical protein
MNNGFIKRIAPTIGYIVLCIVIVIIFLYWMFRVDNSEFLNGMWVGETSFQKQAELDLMYLYINGNAGYLAMKSGDKLLYNGILTINYDKNKLIGINKINVKIPAEIEEKKCPWPKNVILETNMIDGTLKIYDPSDDDNTLYGLFCKNCA